MKWLRIGHGNYESEDGQWQITRGIDRRWRITYPGEVHPDADRPTLREAKAHVEAAAPHVRSSAEAAEQGGGQ